MPDAKPSKRPIQVFFSYAHEDEELRDELAKQLDILERQGVIATWHDRRIEPGEEWAGKIAENLKAADLILLLVSADFLASDYIQDVELNYAMKRHHDNTAIVVPIILRDCLWQQVVFARLEALPTRGCPVTSKHWHNHDEAWMDVATGLLKIIEAHSEFIQPVPKSTQSVPSYAQYNYDERFLSSFVEGALTPVYFLDNDFNVTFMNTAAKIFFGLENFSWMGKTLWHLIDEIGNRLDDIDIIKQRLNCQVEDIRRLKDTGWSRYIPPHFEPVAIKTDAGKIEMTKCGIPVKDPDSGEVNGWVVLYHLRKCPEQILLTLVERVKGIIEARHNPSIVAPR